MTQRKFTIKEGKDYVSISTILLITESMKKSISHRPTPCIQLAYHMLYDVINSYSSNLAAINRHKSVDNS